ncbi:MAG: HPr(Ser) kinase/phosphatase [Eubacteriales bacterium]|nr:HPr(Ser) kinase/phosphatase [bacterium]MDY2791365.1 HPr(Ser) kinase/phosphatase [Eubacteriales bacterium]
MVNAKAMMKALRLTELAPAPTEELRIEASDMNRPGLQLSGFWEHFAYERPQILGLVETSYLRSLEPAIRQERLERFVSYDLPCIIICRHLAGMDDLIDMARARSIPVYRSDSDTTQLIVELIYYLNGALAPSTRMHGVLVEIYGVGVLITGNSGVGKSEAALELLKRGHRLVADDAVDIRRVSAGRLVGQAPEMVRNFMEIRGIGIINVATLFGIGSVMQSKSIDMVVHLEHWQQDKEYDRLGLTDETRKILDVDVPWLLMPIRPGRNLAVVLEVAARNLRLKQQGYSAAKDLEQRFNERMARGFSENDYAD